MRCLKGLFGIKTKDKEVRREKGYSVDGKQKGRWISGNSGRDTDVLCRDPNTIPPNITSAEAAWLRSFYDGSDTEQSKYAIALAAATAVAADAAVAAAQAAVAVVRLTNQERDPTVSFGREKLAALKIQSVFRGYLARRALRALKGLVKLQALMRGFLVRKQAAATLHSMQALIRAQASIRDKKIQQINNNQESYPPQIQPKISTVKAAPNTFTVYNSNSQIVDSQVLQEKDVEPSRRVSASLQPSINPFNESPKIVEVDTGDFRPKSKSRRANSWMLDSGEDSFGKALSLPAHPDGRSCPDQDWGYLADDCGFSTAQSTPRFAAAGCGYNGVATPAKSLCAESYLRSSYVDHPNYMAKTQSFKAKARSYSAPKQRPESDPRRRLSLHQVMESRSSLSGVRMQRSCSQAQEAIIFKNAVMGKIGKSSDFVREHEFFHHN